MASQLVSPQHIDGCALLECAPVDGKMVYPGGKMMLGGEMRDWADKRWAFDEGWGGPEVRARSG